jgi:hypothetical protein
MSTVEQNEYGNAGATHATADSAENVNGASSAAATTAPDGEARHARSSTRIPFDGVVEVGGELGPPFEAQAVNVSGSGMHLRTAYLPDPGQMLSCRFEAGRETVIATGEVVWHREASRGGEFGLRFVDLDAESAAALERMTDRARLKVPGAKVRLHIDGLGAPMRARVKGTTRSELTVGSELGFLQVGKHIDLEDAESGQRRPAFIDRVEVEVDSSSRVPQLVVALKYEDVEDDAAADRAEAGHEARAIEEGRDDDRRIAAMNVDDSGEPAMDDDGSTDVPVSEPVPAGDVHARVAPHAMEDDEIEDSLAMKGPVARAAAKVTPALERFAKRSKTTAKLLIERAKSRRASESSPIRRTTAPPPGGGLTTSGRKVVRGEPAAAEKAPAPSRMVNLMSSKKKMTMAGAGVVAVLALGFAFASKKPAAAPATAPNGDVAANAAESSPAAPAGQPGSTATIPGAPQAPVAPAPVEIASSAGAANEPVMVDDSPVGDAPETHRKKRSSFRVAPFSNGGITRGNLLRLRMDGAIEKIQGAQQPTGFTVQLPGRRSLEPAAPLALRDSRIGSIKVANDPGGAELSVTFKDGVPRYTVRAKGDLLEIVLASPNAAGLGSAPAGASASNEPKDDSTSRPVGHKKVAKRSRHKHPKH